MEDSGFKLDEMVAEVWPEHVEGYSVPESSQEEPAAKKMKKLLQLASISATSDLVGAAEVLTPSQAVSIIEEVADTTLDLINESDELVEEVEEFGNIDVINTASTAIPAASMFGFPKTIWKDILSIPSIASEDDFV